MSLNRRQALLAILTMPAASSSFLEREMQDQNGGTIFVLSPGTQLVLTLADEKDAAKDGGIFALQIRYKGNTLKFSAKEIWEALFLV